MVGHDHALDGGRHRPHRREPVRAGFPRGPGDRRNPRAASAARRGFPQGLQGGHRRRGATGSGYLLLNLVIVAVGLYQGMTHPQYVVDWSEALFTSYGNPLAMIVVALLVFPQLALGLSGFETGVSMMPLVRGDEGDDPERPAGRIRDTRKMLVAPLR